MKVLVELLVPADVRTLALLDMGRDVASPEVSVLPQDVISIKMEAGAWALVWRMQDDSIFYQVVTVDEGTHLNWKGEFFETTGPLISAK